MNLNTSQLNMDTPISILIGENGSGKSQLLASLAYVGPDEDNIVLAIATSIYDKFPKRNFHQNYHYMGARLGRFIPREVIKQAVIKTDFLNSKEFTSIYKVLDYTGYDQKIGFKFSGLSSDYLERLLTISDIDNSNLEKAIHAMSSLGSTSQYINLERHILWFNNNERQYNSNEVLLSELLQLEKILRKHKIIKSIDIYLSKKNRSFPLSKASSGELSLISTLIFISTFIDYNVLILIDEPENSLHPKWQNRYISMIMDMFSYYRPRIVVATHSPIIISGTHSEEGVDIHKYTNSGFQLDNHFVKNTEEIYSDLFDLITPASRTLSNNCSKLLNDYSDEAITFTQATAQINNYISMSYDDTQIEFLQGVNDLLNQIKDKRVS